MTPPPLTRDGLLELGRAGDGYEFINIAAKVLGQFPLDTDLRLLLIQRLTKMGLYQRALAYAQGLQDELLEQPQVQNLLRQLQMPRNNGRVEWSTLASQYAQNLQAIRERYRWAEEMDAAWKQHHSLLELHHTQDGFWQVFDLAAGPLGSWRPAFCRHQPEESAAQLAANVKNRVLPPFVIDGVGLGYHLPMLFEGTADTLHGASPIIYQLEPDLAGLAAALHLHDWRPYIASPRVMFCVGEGACNQLRHMLEDRRSSALPKSLVTCPTWRADTAQQTEAVLKAALSAEVDRCAELRSKATALYKGRDAHYWARRFSAALNGEESPLRVLAVTSRFTTVLQYAVRDSLEALASLGCETRLMIEADHHSIVTSENVLKTICEFEPDLFFMVDHTRRSQSSSVIADMPLVTWIQDRLPWLFNEDAGRAMGPLDFCFGNNVLELTKRWGYPSSRFLPCEMATNPKVLAAARDEDLTHSPYVCDVAYATHASEAPAAFHAFHREQCTSEHGRLLFDGVYEALKAMTQRCELNGALHFDYFLKRIEATVGYEVNATAQADFLGAYVKPLADRFLRHQTIQWAADWVQSTGRAFHLYGNGWDKHPEYARFARGPLPHGLPLAQAFRAAKINLHSGCNHALHQRILDGLCAGGFFLIRRHGADVSYRSSRAVYEWIMRNNARAPVNIRWSDLPAPANQEFARQCRFNGRDPDAPFTLTPAHFANLRAIHEGDDVRLAGQIWPELDEITFETQAEFVERLEYFMANGERRAEIAGSMRRQVLDRYSYEAIMKRLLHWLRDCLAQPVDAAQQRMPDSVAV